MLLSTLVMGQTAFPDHVIQDGNWTDGVHHVAVTQKILSPGDVYQPMDISGTADAEYVSGASIHLAPGFHAGDLASNGKFHAHIDETLGPDGDMVLVAPDPYASVTSNTLHVPKWEKLEIGLRLPQEYQDAIERFFDHYYADADPYVPTPGNVDPAHDLNPYADDSLQLVMTLTKPDGSQTMKWGFFMREGKWSGTADTSLPIEDPDAVLQPYHMRFRLAPDMEGLWQFTLALQAPFTNTTANAALAPALYTGYTFVCDPPLADNHGPLQVNDANWRTLKFEDGTPYFGLGTNLETTGYGTAWNDPNSYRLVWRNFLNATSSMQRLHSVGGNFVRVFQMNKSLAPENSSLGVYDRFNDPVDCARVVQEKGSGQRNSWVMDMLADTARKYGIQIQLCIVPYPPIVAFESYTWLNDPYLHHFVKPRNPITNLYDMKRYFYSNGDPTTADTAGCAFYYWKRKYKYTLSRWGYSVNIPIIEPFNEIDQMLTYHDVNMAPPHKNGNCPENGLHWVADPGLPATYSSWLSDIIHYVKDPVDLEHPATSPLGEGAKLFLVGTGPDDTNNPDWNLPNQNPDVDLVDVHHGMYWGEEELSNSFSASQAFRNTYTSSANGSKRPFHQGESNYYELKDAYGVRNPNDTVTLDAAEYFDNYDVSFHNEIWASTFFGNFAAASTWHKERVFWWSPKVPPRDLPHGIFPGNQYQPFGLFSNVLGVTNLLDLGVNGAYPVVNKPIYHNFKPLADFLANPNLQAYDLFNGDFSPHKVYDGSTKIESYYLTNADSTFAIGWVHNLNASWEKHFYVQQAVQNYLGCTPPAAQSVALPGFQPALDYHITWFSTRMNDTIHPVDAVDTSGTGTVVLDMSSALLGGTLDHYLDTLRLDYAFIIALQPVHRNMQVSSEVDPVPTESDWTFSMYPNPAGENVVLLLPPDGVMRNIAVYDLTGSRVVSRSNMTGALIDLPTGSLARGAYCVRVSDAMSSQTKTLILH